MNTYSQREPPKPITKWDWPDTLHVPDGYNLTQVPELSRANLQFLADKYNELIEHLFQQPSDLSGETK